jgi:hypothetical protein
MERPGIRLAALIYGSYIVCLLVKWVSPTCFTSLPGKLQTTRVEGPGGFFESWCRRLASNSHGVVRLLVPPWYPCGASFEFSKRFCGVCVCVTGKKKDKPVVVWLSVFCHVGHMCGLPEKKINRWLWGCVCHSGLVRYDLCVCLCVAYRKKRINRWLWGCVCHSGLVMYDLCVCCRKKLYRLVVVWSCVFFHVFVCVAYREKKKPVIMWLSVFCHVWHMCVLPAKKYVSVILCLCLCAYVL